MGRVVEASNDPPLRGDDQSRDGAVVGPEEGEGSRAAGLGQYLADGGAVAEHHHAVPGVETAAYVLTVFCIVVIVLRPDCNFVGQVFYASYTAAGFTFLAFAALVAADATRGIGEALTAYIRHDRVSTLRALFVTQRAPHAPFKDGQMVNAVLKEAFATAGVTPPNPYVGSHVLRHSLATNMVGKGASLAEVGDMLRHRSRASTLIYAKLDIDGLRSIAQPWPAAGGVQ